MTPYVFTPGNIWSGDRTGLAVLTNPTELAHRKGNLRHHYPVTIWGETYPDAEAAYQKLKRTWDQADWQDLMVEIIIHKLVQYPAVIASLEISGGARFLEQCSHIVPTHRNGRSWWEGKGSDSPFIRCLLKAFWFVKTPS